MSKLQLFRDFVNERLAAAAFEIFEQYEITLAECQDEICRLRENSEPLQRMLDNRTDVQQLCLPENPQIKEEQELWTSQGGEQLQWLQSDTTDSIFTSPTVKTYCDPEDPNQLPPLYQTPTVENRCTNTTEEQIKAASNEEDYGAPEPSSDTHSPSVTPDFPTAQLSLRTKSIPWTSPIHSDLSGSESEDFSSRESESKTVEKQYQCEYCDKAFSHKGTFIRHRRIHTREKTYQCQECDKAFNHKGTFIRHIRIHTREKPYQCQECVKAFTRKSSLLRHVQIHTGEKPYQSEKSVKAFSQKCSLGIHTREKTYQCQECDKVFSHKGTFIRHRRTHTEEKPYQCQECDKAFNSNGNLTRHIRTHTGEKPYQCEECAKTFNDQSNLIIHRRIHTGEKPYHCGECGKTFTNLGTLIKHRDIHTRDKPHQYE